jgi:hypothetical protein
MAALGLPLGVGCAARAEDSAPPGIRELEVRAEDFRFRAPDTVAEGLTRIRLVNQGHEQHHLQLLRLEDGHTAEEVLEDARRGELVTSGTTYVGGPSIPAPGSASEVTVDLEPGQYLMVCYMSSRGVQHLLLGMARRLVVVPSPARPTIPPKADAQLTLDSYSFGLTSALRAGRQIVRVENVAEQPHEVGFVRVSPGHSAAEVLQWLKDESGPPPFAPAGGSMMLSQGGVSFVTLDLEPGEYVLLCFVPDAEDDQPHVAHGMVRAIRIP